MSTIDYIKSYMVKVGVDVDQVSFSKFDGAIKSTEKRVEELAEKMAHGDTKISKFQAKIFSLIKGFGKLSSAMVTASIGIGKFLQNTVDSDMEMQKLARRFYISTDRAKALQNTLDAMNLSLADLQDVAYNPELLAQYKEIFSLAKSFKAPDDLKNTFKEVRSIFKEFQKFNLIFQVFKERVAYFIYKVVQGPARAFKKWFSIFNNNFAKNVDRWSSKIGLILGMIMRLTGRLIEFIVRGIDRLAEAWNRVWNLIPENMRKWVIGIGGLMALYKMGPMGAILGATALYDDYRTFKEGGNSNNFLKPLWTKLDQLLSLLNDLLEKMNSLFSAIKNSRIGKWLGLEPDTPAGPKGAIGTIIQNRLLNAASDNSPSVSLTPLGSAMATQMKNNNTTNQTFNFTILGQALESPKAFVDEVSSLIRNNQGILVGD